MQGDNEIGLYVMPGMDEYEFDSDEDADEQDDDLEIDMDGFFSEIPANTKVSNKQKKTAVKLRPPTILGDEQRKMYQELNEISELAPERNDLRHMEHLCQFWMEREAEEI